MDNMASMALTKAEIKERNKEYSCVPSSKPPQYPWGLEVVLNEDSLEKLSVSTPKYDSYVTITARARVSEVSESTRSTSDGQKDRRSVTLQIEEMALAPDNTKRAVVKRKSPVSAAKGKPTARKRGA